MHLWRKRMIPPHCTTIRRHDSVAWIPNLFGTSLIGGTTQFTSQAAPRRRGSQRKPGLPRHQGTYLVANLKDLGFAALGDFSAGIGLNNPFGSLT